MTIGIETLFAPKVLSKFIDLRWYDGVWLWDDLISSLSGALIKAVGRVSWLFACCSRISLFISADWTLYFWFRLKSGDRLSESTGLPWDPVKRLTFFWADSLIMEGVSSREMSCTALDVSLICIRLYPARSYWSKESIIMCFELYFLKFESFKFFLFL
jgi:hypothetical protein